MKHHDLSTLAAKVAKEHLITNNMNLLSDIPRLGFEAPCKLALDQTVFRSGRWQNIIPVKLVKVSGLKHLFSIYPGVFREHDHVTTAKVKNGGWQFSYPEMTYSLKRAFKLDPIAREYTSLPSHVRWSAWLETSRFQGHEQTTAARREHLEPSSARY